MHCLLWNLAPDGFIYKSMIKQIFSQVLEDCISVWNYMTWYLSTLFSSPERSEWNPQKVPRHLAINLTVNYMLTAMCNKLTHWIQVTGCLTMKKKIGQEAAHRNNSSWKTLAKGRRLTYWVFKKCPCIISTSKYRWSVPFICHAWKSTDSMEDTTTKCGNQF